MKNFLQLHGLSFDFYHVSNGTLIRGKQDLTAHKKTIKELLHIYEGTLNAIGEEKTALSSSWYKRQPSAMKKQPSANARNFLMHKQKASAEDCIWSTFSEIRNRAPVKDYASGFVACNMRASNEYGNRHKLAYLLNVFEHPYVVKWFSEQGVTVDQDAFALSQLLQWIWRSAIRNGAEVHLYLPSKRMRQLL